MNLDPVNQLSLYGHHSEFSNFIKLYKSEKLPNKILLSGQKGIGKSTLAYHIINHILSINEDFSYDTKNFKINPGNKSFKLILNKSSFNTKPRFVLIDNIELLNINSVNALLKILEEPNDNIFFYID